MKSTPNDAVLPWCRTWWGWHRRGLRVCHKKIFRVSALTGSTEEIVHKWHRTVPLHLGPLLQKPDHKFLCRRFLMRGRVGPCIVSVIDKTLESGLVHSNKLGFFKDFALLWYILKHLHTWKHLSSPSSCMKTIRIKKIKGALTKSRSCVLVAFCGTGSP